jgi:hypothetical protein
LENLFGKEKAEKLCQELEHGLRRQQEDSEYDPFMGSGPVRPPLRSVSSMGDESSTVDATTSQATAQGIQLTSTLGSPEKEAETRTQQKEFSTGAGDFNVDNCRDDDSNLPKPTKATNFDEVVDELDNVMYSPLKINVSSESMNEQAIVDSLNGPALGQSQASPPESPEGGSSSKLFASQLEIQPVVTGRRAGNQDVDNDSVLALTGDPARGQRMIDLDDSSGEAESDESIENKGATTRMHHSSRAPQKEFESMDELSEEEHRRRSHVFEPHDVVIFEGQDFQSQACEVATIVPTMTAGSQLEFSLESQNGDHEYAS